MKKLIFSTCVMAVLTSCSRLTSTTSIKPKESFVLGNNEHGKFSVRLKNISKSDIKIWEEPIGGGRHSPITVKTNEKACIKLDKNTALRIINDDTIPASVSLLVKGDTGLSMGYKNN